MVSKLTMNFSESNLNEYNWKTEKLQTKILCLAKYRKCYKMNK